MAIVMKSAVRSRFPDLFPGVNWEWFIIENPFRRIKILPGPDTQLRETITDFGAREVERRDALEYIKSHDLVLVYKTKDGEIYDLPDEPFKREFSLSTEARKEAFKRFWE